MFSTEKLTLKKNQLASIRQKVNFDGQDHQLLRDTLFVFASYSGSGGTALVRKLALPLFISPLPTLA